MVKTQWPRGQETAQKRITIGTGSGTVRYDKKNAKEFDTSFCSFQVWTSALWAVIASLACFEKLQFYYENSGIFHLIPNFTKKMLMLQVVAKEVPKDAEFNGEFERSTRILNIKVTYG